MQKWAPRCKSCFICPQFTSIWLCCYHLCRELKNIREKESVKEAKFDLFHFKRLHKETLTVSHHALLLYSQSHSAGENQFTPCLCASLSLSLASTWSLCGEAEGPEVWLLTRRERERDAAASVGFPPSVWSLIKVCNV